MWEKRVKEKGSMVNIKRVKRLCRLTGLNAMGTKSNTSKLALWIRGVSVLTSKPGYTVLQPGRCHRHYLYCYGLMIYVPGWLLLISKAAMC